MSSSPPSRAGSARSSPSPQSPFMLTPTSRVKALLAAFDDSDEEEETSLPITKSKSPTTTRPQASNYEVEFEISGDEEPGSEKTQSGPIPLNLDKDVTKPQSDDEDEETSGNDAYARLQKQLMSKKPVRSSPPPAPVPASDSDSDLDPLPKLQRQLVSKRLARSSPAPVNDSDSDSLFRPRKQLISKTALQSDPALGDESDSDSLFVSNKLVRSDPTPSNEQDSDSLPDNVANPRFQALVAKKRAERQANERQAKERAAKGIERIKEREAKVVEAYKDVFSSEMDDGMDEVARKAMTERSRPSARKATKKAQEEMQRQIQRDLRNQQLAHEAKTKKRITTKDLFKVFNFMQDPAPASKETPPSSPPPLHSELPGIDEARMELGTFMPKPKKRVPVIPKPRADDSDDDLEIVPKTKSRFAVFDRTPEKNASSGQSFLLLRALARVNSPSKAKPAGRNSLNAGELQANLQDRMRMQALAEKQERLDELKARGIIIQTVEERERDQLHVENMLERARDDAQALAKEEKKAATKDGKDGEVAKDILSDDESEDEDWEEEADDVEAELSGSEEEDGEDEAEHEEIGEAGANMFVDGEASEDEEDEEDQLDADGDIELADVSEDDESIPSKSRSKARARHVIEDDEDDEEQDQPAPSAKPSQPSQDNTLAAFGFIAPQSSLGLTQMFKGTMDELQSQDIATPGSLPNGSLDFLRQLPAPTLPELSLGDTQPVLVHNSQTEPPRTQDTEGPIILQTPLKSLAMPSQFLNGSAMSPTKLSEVPEPTQDAGFEDFGAPASTVDTIMMTVTRSPAQPKKGKKLRRRNEAVAVLSDDEGVHADAGSASEDDEFAPSKDAFDILFKAAKKTPAVNTFDKKHSDAKKMVEEQAEESEDEYAGLGGASDDGSDGEMDEEMKQMIDEGPVDVDEGKLAKFYADRDRAEDEKRIDKLYKDITTGGLRRKRGADLDDLDDDSDDEAQERRRRKQREFARMRKALLEDENIGKIAENPKKLAFLRAIEDRDEEEALDYFDEPEAVEPESIPDSQVESGDADGQEQDNAPSADATVSAKRKLPTEFELSQGKENIAPVNPRRRPADETSKRAKTLAEIREAVSFLIDEPLVPDSQVSGSEAGSDYEDEDEDEASDDGEDGIENVITTTRVRRQTTILRTVRPSIINRLSMTRTHSEVDIASGPLAFHAPIAGSTSGGFKVPSLLRRATTSLSTTSNTSSGTATPSAGGTESGVRRGGSKKSNIHYQAREAERKKVVDASERRRKEEVKKTVLGTGRQSILGSFGVGKHSGFE